MKLHVNGEYFDAALTERVIEEQLLSLPGGDNDSFLVLSSSDMSYIQASGSFDEGFILEYQEESIEHHYACVDQLISQEKLIQAFKDYLNGTDAWKNDLAWEKEEISSRESGAGIIVCVLVLVTIALGYGVWRFL